MNGGIYLNESDLDRLAVKLARRITTPRWLRMSQAVQYAGVGKTELRKLLRDGDIAGYQRNDRGDWIIDRESIDRFHESNIGDIEIKIAEIKKKLGL